VSSGEVFSYAVGDHTADGLDNFLPAFFDIFNIPGSMEMAAPQSGVCSLLLSSMFLTLIPNVT